MNFYSPSLNGFFDGVLRGQHGIRWPADAIEITDDEFRTYVGVPPMDMTLGPGLQGRPRWVPADGSAGLSVAHQVELMGSWYREYLNDAARLRGYDSIDSAVSWAGDLYPLYAAEGDAFKAWRSRVWAVAMPIINAVANGKGHIPTQGEFVRHFPPFAPPIGSTPLGN